MRTNSKCFWCQTKLGAQGLKKTRDHLFSTFVRERFSNNTLSVHSCECCNQNRGWISAIYKVIVFLEEGNIHKLPSPPKHENIPKMIRKLLRKVNLGDFRRRIKKVKDCKVRSICIMEIDKVLDFAKKEGLIENQLSERSSRQLA